MNIRSLSLIGLPPPQCKHWYAVMYAQSREATSEASKSCGSLKTQQNDGTHCVWFRNPSKRQFRSFLIHRIYESIIQRQKKPLMTLQNKRKIWQSTVKRLIDWNREKNRNNRCTYLLVYRQLPKSKPPMRSESWEKPKPPMHSFNSIHTASYQKKKKLVTLQKIDVHGAASNVRI